MIPSIDTGHPWDSCLDQGLMKALLFHVHDWFGISRLLQDGVDISNLCEPKISNMSSLKLLRSPWCCFCCFVEDIHKVGARSHIEAVRTRLNTRATVKCRKRETSSPVKHPAAIFSSNLLEHQAGFFESWMNRFSGWTCMQMIGHPYMFCFCLGSRFDHWKYSCCQRMACIFPGELCRAAPIVSIPADGEEGPDLGRGQWFNAHWHEEKLDGSWQSI